MKKGLFILAILFPTIGFGATAATDNTAEIAKHYSALPNFYELDKVVKEQLSDKIMRQYVMGSQSMLVKWTLKKGAIISRHFHPNEQVTWITQGSVKVFSQGKEYIVKTGGVLIIPPYVPHEFQALEDTIDIDFFTPVREDWINNTANYISK